MADVAAFRRAVDAIAPGASGTRIAALLDGKVKRTTAIEWYAGRRHAEPWALHLLARKLRAQATPQIELADYLEQIKDRPGKKAGAINLARWLASR